MMIIAQPSPDTVDQNTLTIRALSSITLGQADIIAQAVHAGAPSWAVQTTDDYDGYLSILIKPRVGHDKQQAFYIAGTAQLLELFETLDDDMTLITSFTGAADLSARLLDLITQQ